VSRCGHIVHWGFPFHQFIVIFTNVILSFNLIGIHFCAGQLEVEKLANAEINTLIKELEEYKRKVLEQKNEINEKEETVLNLQEQYDGIKLKLLCAVEQRDQDKNLIKALKKEKNDLESNLKNAKEALQVAKARYQDYVDRMMRTATRLGEKMEILNTKSVRLQQQWREDADAKSYELNEKKREIERLSQTVSEKNNELNKKDRELNEKDKKLKDKDKEIESLTRRRKQVP